MSTAGQPDSLPGHSDGAIASGQIVSQVLPTRNAMVRLRPIGLLGGRIEGGLWADRRRTNHEVTIPFGAEQLEAAGNMHNLKLAAGARGQYRGAADDTGNQAPFLDSDVHKWLEAVGWELAQFPDQKLLALAEPIIELVAKAQRADGYVDSFYQAGLPGKEFTNPEWGHELYVAGHLIQAAIAWRRGLGDDRLMSIAERFVRRIEAEVGPGKREWICGHPEFEMALVELYRTTGEARYLEFARTLVERRGHAILGPCRYSARYWQDHEPVRTALEPAGHAVRQIYLECGVVDVAVETGDRELLDAVVRRWDSMISSRTYITGGLGSRHQDEAFGDAFELPPDRAYAETCAAIGSVMLSWRLLLATGERRFADLIERTAFNAVLPGLASDGTHFFYSNPLMRRSAGIETREGPAATRRANWFPIACCPPNLMRFLACFPDLAATVSDRGLELQQYVTGSFLAPVRDGSVRISTETNYPWEGVVQIAIDECDVGAWTLSMRVPEWCPSATVSMGSERLAESGPGTIELTRNWEAGDRLTLKMAISARATVPDPRIDAVRGTIALERGPLVYAIEDADLPDGTSVESIEVDEAPILTEAVQSNSGLGELTWITLEATLRDDESGPKWPYGNLQARRASVAGGRRIRFGALPYLAWGNRTGLGMRIWLPTGANTAAADANGHRRDQPG
jgi:DUF1680 family protein